jgi:hypothetical protein
MTLKTWPRALKAWTKSLYALKPLLRLVQRGKVVQLHQALAKPLPSPWVGL